MAKKVVVLGAGEMGREYAKVLVNLGCDFSVVGRSEEGVRQFSAETGLPALAHGFKAWKDLNSKDTEFAIIAVNVESLAQTASDVMDFGIRKILLEKPGGLDIHEIKNVLDKAHDTGTKIWVGYNRRFYASVLKARQMIEEDGGVQSFCFEFTEWHHTFVDDPRFTPEVKKNWFLANSSHVADLAFFLGGKPQDWQSYTSGGSSWHPAATVFSGAGTAGTGALFSYQANWMPQAGGVSKF